MSALAAIVLASVACAQGAATPEAHSVEDLERNLASAKARTDLTAAERTKVEEDYKAAINEASAAAALRQETRDIERRQAAAAEEVLKLERTAASAAEAAPPAALTAGAYSLAALETLDAKLRTEAAAAREEVTQLERRTNEIPLRLFEMRRAQATVRNELRELESRAEAPPSGIEGSEVARAAQFLLRARLDARRARLERLEHEIAYQPALSRLLTLQRDIALSDLAQREAILRESESLIERRRAEEIARLRAEAQALRARSTSAGDPALAQAQLAEWNAKLAETTVALDRIAVALTERRRMQNALEQRVREAKQRAVIGDHVDELPRELADELHGLVRSQNADAARQSHALEVERVADDRAEVRRRREELADVGAVAHALAAAQPAGAPVDERALRRDLVAERNVLTRLDAQLGALLGAYAELDYAGESFASRTREARDEIVRLLFWVPLSPIGAETIAQLKTVPKWIAEGFDPRVIRDSFRRSLQSRPLRTVAPFLVAFALIGFRRLLAATLARLTPGAVGAHRFHIGHTFAALAVTLGLALPAPLVLWGLGAPLRAPHVAPSFLESLGFSLQYTTVVLTLGLVLWWSTAATGVALAHFQWRRAGVQALRRALPVLLYAYVPLVLVTTLGTWEAPDTVRQSLGRLSFVAAMIVTAVALFIVVRGDPRGAHARGFTQTSGAFALFGPLLRWGVPLLPIVLAVLACAGFFFAAIFVFQLINTSVLIVTFGALLYGLIAVWAAIQRMRLATVQAHASATAAGTTSPEGVPIASTTLDVEAIDRATRQFLNTVITVAVALALWALWHEAFPAFDRIGNFALWRHTETVNGAAVESVLTLGEVLEALVVGVVAWIATKNAGGMLDVILLRRLALQPDANYAIKTVARYVIAGVGIVAVAQLIGINWSRAQWLVAALGVGLGFGLQEIVANFVSGLIVLAERPIRVGDLVTVGGTSGQVKRIRARATVIVDYDNKEVLIPNKEFITQRVVNWTLTSEVTRLLLTVGVAYGTLPERAQRVIEDAVRRVPGVLDDPAPSVFLVTFGESALQFEVRAYCANIADRLPLTHAINTSIAHALAAAGIEIPFPQRDVHIRQGEAIEAIAPPTQAPALNPVAAGPRSQR